MATDLFNVRDILDYCECGHPFHDGPCPARVDTRHVTAGGSELTPCACKTGRRRSLILDSALRLPAGTPLQMDAGRMVAQIPTGSL